MLQAQRSVSLDKIPAHLQSALGAISANSLRGHLSFIASDLLEGRDSPSRGLDIAAEYIAAQFRRAGLEPVGGDGYFQTANWSVAAQDLRSFRLQLAFDGRTLDVGAQQVSFRIASAVRSVFLGGLQARVRRPIGAFETDCCPNRNPSGADGDPGFSARGHITLGGAGRPTTGVPKETDGAKSSAGHFIRSAEPDRQRCWQRPID